MVALRMVLIVMFLSSEGWAWGQSLDMKVFPPVELGGELGGTLAGGTWRSKALLGKPALIAVVNPDYQNKLSPIEQAIDEQAIQASSGQFIKILDTQASWKPDRAIQAGVWWDKMAETIEEAREDGIVQALFMNRSRKKADWLIVYDRDGFIRKTLKLDEQPVHLFLLDAQGQVVDRFKGSPGNQLARSWVQQMVRRGTS